MTDKIQQQLDQLRIEWAKAPFTAKAVAGAYITPLLDLLDTMRMQAELMAADVSDMKQRRQAGLEAMQKVIAKGEAMQAFPDWMLTELKQIAGGEING